MHSYVFLYFFVQSLNLGCRVVVVFFSSNKTPPSIPSFLHDSLLRCYFLDHVSLDDMTMAQRREAATPLFLCDYIHRYKSRGSFFRWSVVQFIRNHMINKINNNGGGGDGESYFFMRRWIVL